MFGCASGETENEMPLPQQAVCTVGKDVRHVGAGVNDVMLGCGSEETEL